MKCPYCQGEMEQGLIQSTKEICWIPGEKRRVFAAAALHEGSVVLSEFDFFRGSAVVAWLCRACRKVIIDCGGDCQAR